MESGTPNQPSSEPASPLPATDLTEGSILSIFHLTRDTRADDVWTLANDNTFDVPEHLESTLAAYNYVFDRSQYSHPRFMRSRLDLILISCIADTAREEPPPSRQKTRLGRLVARMKPRWNMRIIPRRSSGGNRRVNYGESMHLRCETSVQSRISYHGRPRILTASSDHGLWYKDAEKLGPSLVVVLEGRKRDGSVSTEAECLGFMAMVHHIRKEAGVNPTVYGISTDTFGWKFFRIDRHSRVSKSPGMDWEWGYSRQVISHIRKIVRESISMAPGVGEARSGWMARYGSEYRFTGSGFEEERSDDEEDEDE